MRTAAGMSIRWMVVGLIAFVAGAQTAQAARKLVRIVLDGPIVEAPLPDAELAILFGAEPPASLYSLVKTVDAAAKDKDVAGIALILETPMMNLAQVEELSRAFERFRGSGKKIYTYMDAAGNASYALAAATDHITLAENGTLMITGLNAQLSFFKGMFDKIGVEADMLACGAYKSAREPFTRTEPSKESADQVNWLLDGLYERWVELIATGRKLSVEDARAAIDNAPLDSGPALERKLIDAAGSFGEYRRLLHKEFGSDVEVVKDYGSKKKLELDMSNPFAIFDMFNKLMETTTAAAKPGIALIYVEGGITTGKSAADFMSGSTSAGSTTIRAAIEKAHRDDAIKAVVLRVDSPGGSALASDIMWKAATRLGQDKPLIVSMGGVAGSGGYYVSIPGDQIFAEATTITGSIGVVGGKLVWNELWEDKIGITTTEFNRGRHAGLFSFNRPWTPEERGWVQNWMNSIYAQFKERVKSSRGERIKGELEQLAGGRVYTGQQALERGLVDRIGGLHDALALAAEKAGLSEYEVYVLPKPKDFGEILAELMGQPTEDEYELAPRKASAGGASFGVLRGAAAGELGRVHPLMAAVAPYLKSLAPEQLEALAEGLRNAMILDREHVGCFMPFVLRVR